MQRKPLADAVIPDPNASYEAAMAAPTLSVDEAALVDEQLGRPSRGRSAVVHTCGHGLPTVVRVDPRLDNGTPFPTTFWSTCPLLNSAIGTLEAEQFMVATNERVTEDPAFASAYDDAQQRLVAFRDELGAAGQLPGNPTAGGKPGHVKCVHTHAAQFLATGDNVVGQLTVEATRPLACPGP
ncbi:MAG: hypothetical protein ACI867_001391, partial [Glaciecola sp.]